MSDQEREALELAKETIGGVPVTAGETFYYPMPDDGIPQSGAWHVSPGEWQRWGARACKNAEGARRAVKAALAAREGGGAA
jgi:hypothetical protein